MSETPIAHRKATGTPVIWAVAIAAAIFILDLQLPLGVADGMLYVALVLLGLRARSRRFLFMAALSGTLLTIAGFYLSPPGGEFLQAAANRGLSILTIWITAFLCLWQIRAGEKIRESNKHLEKRVRERTLELDATLNLLRREKEFVQLHKDIAVASNETHTVEATLEYGLKRVCEHTGWPVGHIYLPNEQDPGQLEPTTIWYLEQPDQFKTFREITEATSLNKGVGLPGRVMENGEATWIIDVTRDPNFPRAKQAQNIGVKAGFAFPILIDREIVGVMEFFSSQAVEPDKEMLEIMGQVGTQLGRVIERKRAEAEQRKLLKSLKERVKELTSMYGVANLISTSQTMGEILKKVGSHIIPGMQYPELTRVKVHFEGDTYPSEPFEEPPWKLSRNIAIHGGVHGSLDVFYNQPVGRDTGDPFLKEERDMIDGLAHLLSVAAERKQAEKEIEHSREQLRKLYHRLELVREEERTRMAREIHDELAQILTTLKLEVALLDKKLVHKASDLRSFTQLISQLIDNSIQMGKKLAMDLRPPILDELGLTEAIEWQTREFEKRTGIQCQMSLDRHCQSLDKERATTLFRIFQETLTNVTRHANANRIWVELFDRNGQVTLKVKDNGIGITSDQISNLRSLGLLGIRERTLVWGGEVDIEGTPDAGTTVTIRIHSSKQDKLP